MTAGLPVIGTKVGETELIIKWAMVGQTLEPSPEAFASVAQDLLYNRSKYKAYAKNVADFAKNHGWNQLLDQELTFIEQ